MANLRDRVTAAIKAFREPQLITAPLDVEEFSAFESRKVRYALLWAFFENTAYRKLQTWSHTYKIEYGLYRYIRAIYNPANRLGQFWQTHLMGGQLDPGAGDGTDEPSALPILTDHKNLRAPIAQLWLDSNWQTNKDIFTLWGSIFGDVALEIVDDPIREKCYLKIVSPSLIKDLDVDPFGNVKGYTYEETRLHPEADKDSIVTYTEIAERDGQNVVYRTELNGKPYAWPHQLDARGNPVAEWERPYGFIPLVVVQHNDVGLDWGWSEMHPGRTKFQEADDLASKLSDQLRKSIEAVWFFSGVDKPKETPTMLSRDSESYQETSSSLNRPEPGREEMTALYGPQGSSATPLVAPVDIASASTHIASILAELERDYPELQMDIWTAAGESSGRALRIARQRCEAKVRLRRGNYDDALVRAHQMGIAIAGWRGYKGFKGYGLESYDRGELEHSIAKRPVFAKDPLDDIEVETAFWMSAKEAVAAGAPLVTFLRRQGWTEDEIEELQEDQAAQAQLGLEMMAPWNLEEPGEKPGEEPEQTEEEPVG